MLYKPKYCCNCAEKIERADWNLLTSRRFCDVCSAENKRYDHLPRIAVAGGFLSLMFGLGTLFGGSANSVPMVQSLDVSPVQLKNEKIPERRTDPDRVLKEQPAVTETTTVANSTGNSPIVGSKQPSAEVAHYCGALTKKGTPCSRKVKAAGLRCFQHEGKASATSAQADR